MRLVVLQVLEWAENGSLHDVLATGCLSQDTKNRIAAECALALAHLHSLNIVHGNITSKNVLITYDWHAKLGDIGLARVLHHPLSTPTSRSFLGSTSLRYSAPEMLDKGSVPTQASDVFSFGVLLHQITTEEV